MTEYLAVAFAGGQSLEEPKRYAYLGILSVNGESNPESRRKGSISLGYVYVAAAKGRMEIRYKGPNLNDAKQSVSDLEDITNNSSLLHCLLSRPVPLTPKSKDGTQLFGWEVSFKRH